MKVRDVIGGSARNEELDARYLRPILDTISACLNVAISAIRVGAGGPEFLVHSYQNPFLQIVRQYQPMLDAELEEIAACLPKADAAPVASSCAWLDAGGRFSARLVNAGAPGLYLMLGPVALRDENGCDPLALRAGREEICAQIFETVQRRDGKTEILESRLRRFIAQRSAIDAVDHAERMDAVAQAFEAVLDADIHFELLTADLLEAMTKAVVFWSQRRATLSDKTRVAAVQLHQFSEEDVHEPFDITISRDDDDRLAFATSAPVQSASKEMSEGERVRWGRFCDDFRTCRNFYFHEQLTLLRLWMQDEFIGVTIQSERGKENADLFNKLAQKIALISGADICVIHRYLPGESASSPWNRQGYLDQIGSYSRDEEHDAALELEFDHLRDLGDDEPVEREKSACYRCIDSTPPAPVFLSQAQEGHISSVTQLKPKSVLALPLLSRHRVWGAIELLGRKPGQLQQRTVRWVAEIARIITQPLYTQWMLFHVREMSAIAASDDDIKTKYEGLLDHVRKMLLASSARLYLQDFTQSAIFSEGAHTGHVWDEEIATSFSLEDPESVSARTIHDDLLWRAGVLGEGEFKERETGGRLKPLESHGHRHVAVIPIRGANGNCFASMMITSMDDEPFPEEWEAIVRTISSQLTVILEKIYLQRTLDTERTEIFAHSVKTRIDRVNEGGERILRLLGPLFSDPHLLEQMPRFIALAQASIIQSGPANQTLNRDTQELLTALRQSFPVRDRAADARNRTLLNAFEDFQTHLSELRSSAVRLSGGRNSEHPDDARPATWKGTPSLLRACLEQSLKPMSDKPGYGGRLVMPPQSVLGWDVRVRMPEQLLVEIINNLLDNAFKYDFAVPSVSVQITSSNNDDFYTLTIGNLAPVLDDKEADQLADGGVRGMYAQEKEHDGSGVGLKFSMERCGIWGQTLTYKPARRTDPKNTNQNLGRHVVELRVRNEKRRSFE